MMEGSFLEQTNERRLPEDYSGPVLLWDIDKTYLNTNFSSFWGLAAIPFELAVDKEAIPGVIPLIRALRHGSGQSNAIVPLYFISGSPPQLRRVIEEKMTLDGVDFDGITFKDQWGLLKAGRPRDMSSQVGYKLKALLLYRRQLPRNIRWLMFGDDAESDADIFVLFGQICSGLRGAGLQSKLQQHDVHPHDQRELLALAEALPVEDQDPVELICIRQVRRRSSLSVDPRVFSSSSYLATALLLAHRGHITQDAVATVVRTMRRRGVSDADLRAAEAYARDRFGVVAPHNGL